MMISSMKNKKHLQSIISVALLIALWQITAQIVGKPVYYPSFTQTISALANLALTGSFWITVTVSILRVIGSFAINGNYLDILVMFAAGVVGYLLIKGGFPLSPIVLALILGPMAEGNLRRSLVMSHGDYSIFFTHPIAATFIVVALVSLLWPIVKHLLTKYGAAMRAREMQSKQ